MNAERGARLVLGKAQALLRYHPSRPSDSHAMTFVFFAYHMYYAST
jgi:hypothetical protein